jgi:hypothetical protein
MPQIDYVVGLSDVFIDQYDMFRLRKRSGHVIPK